MINFTWFLLNFLVVLKVDTDILQWLKAKYYDLKIGMVYLICKVFFKLLLWFLGLQLVSLYGEALETLGGGVSLVEMGHDRQAFVG